MSGSSFSLTTFAPSGKLMQVDYALNAVAAGKTTLGIKAKNGVVIATEKKIASILVDETTHEKICSCTDNIGMAYSGMGPDFRVLVKKGRKIAQTYFLEYKDPQPASQFVREVASVAQEFTQSGGVRPFGVSLLVAAYDDDGPSLWQVDPSGSYWAWKASAIGANSMNAKTFLEKRFDPEMELDDAIHTAIQALKIGFEGAVTEDNIEIGVVDHNRQFRLLKPSEIKDYIGEVGGN